MNINVDLIEIVARLGCNKIDLALHRWRRVFQLIFINGMASAPQTRLTSTIPDSSSQGDSVRCRLRQRHSSLIPSSNESVLLKDTMRNRVSNSQLYDRYPNTLTTSLRASTPKRLPKFYNYIVYTGEHCLFYYFVVIFNCVWAIPSVNQKTKQAFAFVFITDISIHCSF